AFLEGTLESISVDPLGVLRLANRVEVVAGIDEPFLLSANRRLDGWVVGTGNAGRVFAVDQAGQAEILFETEEPEVFAVWADDDGTVYAGSSPGGKVYRYREGELDVLFETGETYVWALRGDDDGNLLIATGTQGKLFVVSADGTGALLYDSDDTHLRTLQPLADGSILAGTAGEGLVLQIQPDGSARTLFDAPAPEVIAFTDDGAGGAYFAAVASEASFVDLARRRTSESAESEGQNGNGNDSDDGDVKVSATGDSPASGSRPAGYRGARSRIYRLGATGEVHNVWKFEEETAYSLLWANDRLWVGTGLQGQLYSFQNDQMVLEKDVDASQIVALAAGASGPSFATTNGASLYRFSPGSEHSGTLTSDVHDAKLASTFGTLHWRGIEPDGSEVRFTLRVGMSANPDSTWTDWSEARRGRAISLDDLARGRYLQWRVELESQNGANPEVHGVEISYLQANQRPEITKIEVLDPGQILVPNNFNPANQAYEPAHPNRDGIFTTLERAEKRDGRSLKTLWKQGFRTLRWTASDPNEDDLEYRLEFRRESDTEGWLEMGEKLDKDRYSFDATVLPDGAYRFRLTASDENANAADQALSANRVSESVVIDHTAPRVVSAAAEGAGLSVVVDDAQNIVREAVASIDAGEWTAVAPIDTLLDARREAIAIEVPDGTTLVLLRLTDAAHNVMTYDLSEYLR
ncbi:MAG: hypothetical protein VYE73_13110, partial [Acidobacteriota bacterium]|nr:hypothetical protein [Acidobacteriota bacterium]